MTGATRKQSKRGANTEATGLLQAERNIYEDDDVASAAVDSRGRPIYEDEVFDPPVQAAVDTRELAHLLGGGDGLDYNQQSVSSSSGHSPSSAAVSGQEDTSCMGSLWMVRLVFFLQCAAGCCVCNFLVLFFHDKGLSYKQIGFILGGIYPAANMIGQPVGCWLADHFGCHKTTMMICLMVGSGVQFSLKYAEEFWQLAAVTGGAALINGCVSPMIDNAAMHTLGRHNVPKSDYGKFRVFGALGWGGMAIGLGPALDKWGLDVLFYSYAAVSLIFVITMATFRVTIVDDDKAAAAKAGAAATYKRLSTLGFLRALLSKADTVLFFVLVMVMGICKATIDVFLFLYLQNDLGASSALLGISLLVTTVGEVPFFFFSGALFRRFGTTQVIVFALVAYGIRTAYYAMIHDFGHHDVSTQMMCNATGANHTAPTPSCAVGNPWLVLPVELLHGVCFSLSWSAVASHAQEISPPGYTATTQGLVSATFWGLGFAIGGIGGGFFNDSYGAPKLYQWTSVLAFGTAIFGGVAIACMRPSKKAPPAP